MKKTLIILLAALLSHSRVFGDTLREFKITESDQKILTNHKWNTGYRLGVERLKVDGVQTQSKIFCQASKSRPISHFGYCAAGSRYCDTYSFKFSSVEECSIVARCVAGMNEFQTIILTTSMESGMVVNKALPEACFYP